MSKHNKMMQANESNTSVVAPRDTSSKSLGHRISGSGSDEDMLDLRQIWRYLYRQKKMILAVTLLSILVTYTANLMLRPTYVATTVVTIGPNSGAIRYDQLEDVVDSFRNYSRFHNTQLRLLKGEKVATRVIDLLDLDQDREFLGDIKQRGFVSGLRQIGGYLQRLIKSTEQASKPSVEVFAQTKHDAVLQYFASHLSIELEQGTNLVTVQFTSFNPATAAKVANMVVQAYLQVDEEQNIELNERLRYVLENKLHDVQQKLQDSERLLMAYAREKGTGAVDIESEANLAANQLSVLNQEFLRAQTNRIELSSKVKNGTDSSNNAIISSILDDSAIKTMETRKIELFIEKARLLEIYQPGYPKIKQIVNEINSLDQYIATLTQKHILALEAEFKAAQDREIMLGKALETQSNAVLDLKDRSIEYNLMKREWESNKHLYSGLLERVKQSGVSFDLELSNVTVIENAQPPSNQATPKILKNSLTAGSIGFFLSLGIAGIIGLLDRRLRTPEDLEQLSAYPNLSITPHVSHETLQELNLNIELLSSSNQLNQAFEETFRSLRTSLTYSLPGGIPQTLMITSSLPDEGKTTTIVNLALCIQKIENKNILLLDLDFRKPRLHEIFGIAKSPGVTDYIVTRSDDLAVHEVSNTDASYPGRLSVLTAGPLSNNPIELLESIEFDSLLTRLKTMFDLILIDCPPVMGLADSMVISTKAEAVLVAVCPGVATIDSVKNCFARLEAVNAHVIGTVLTKFDTRSERYYYKEYYQYNYKLDKKQNGVLIE